MKWLSDKFTGYVIKSGVVSADLYALYQYGFQIGLEMFCCFITCLAIALYLHMVLEFIVFTCIFVLLRTYAGGVHLNNFWSCYLCSVIVQTAVMIVSDIYMLPIDIAWRVLVIVNILILKYAPVETVNHELESDEKRHCKKNTVKIVAAILTFAVFCTLGSMYEMVSLVAWTVIVVWVSLYIGAVKYKIEKSKIACN